MTETYYNQPVIKKSPWTWDIPAYYFVGGLSGAAAALGAAASLVPLGHARRYPLDALILRTRYIATLGSALSAAFLIHDLGRPERFLYMLRVFRPTSPMSVGTYILSGFSAAAASSLLTTGWLARASAIKAGFLGLGLAGYTGVLISNTVVPLWKRPRQVMPVLFMASGAASAASLLDLMSWNPREERAIRIYGIAGKVAELACMKTVECQLAAEPEVARPLHEGFTGVLWHTGKVLSAASLVLSLVPSRAKGWRRAAGVLGCLGAVCMRFGIHYAGQRSALNPRATLYQQVGRASARTEL